MVVGIWLTNPALTVTGTRVCLRSNPGFTGTVVGTSFIRDRHHAVLVQRDHWAFSDAVLFYPDQLLLL